MKFGLVYGHVASNIGDLCINKGVVSLLKYLYPDSSLHVVYRDPNEEFFKLTMKSFLDDYKVTYTILNTSTKKKDELSIFEVYFQTPEKFLIETGLINCDVIFNNSGEFLFANEGDYRLDLLWRLLPAFAAKENGIKYVTLPATFGPFEDAIGSRLIKDFLLVNDNFAAREPISSKYVSQCLSDDSVVTVLDPAFFITNKSSHGISDNMPRLGVIMRLEDFGLRIGGKMSSKRLKFLRENEFESSLAFKSSLAIIRKFIECEKGVVDIYVQTRFDEELAIAISDALSDEGYSDSVELIKPSSIEEYMTLLSKSTFVISSRFHGCILSIQSGVPTMGIHFESHGHKLLGLYRLLGISGYCYTMTDTKALGDIVETFLNLYKNRSHAFRNVKELIGNYKISTYVWLEKAVNQPFNKTTTFNLSESIRTYLQHIETEEYSSSKYKVLVNELQHTSEEKVQVKVAHEQSNLMYYKYVVLLVQGFASNVKSIIDVGSAKSPLLEEFEWIPKRICLDKDSVYHSENVVGIKSDFFKFETDEKFDFSICIQVLQYIKNPKSFVEKLFSISDHVLISVPYKWRAGSVRGHIQSNIDLDKMFEWTGRKPRYHVVVTEPFTTTQRLICYYPPIGSKISLLEARNQALRL